VALFHRKCNVDYIHKPMGFELEFGDLSHKITPTHVDYQDFKDTITIGEQIIETLKGGKFKSEELAQELDMDTNKLRVSLNRLNKGGKVIRMKDNYWGLSFED